MTGRKEVEEVPVLLLPCVTCGRTFKPEALAKHSKVCEQQQIKKRKKFDSAKQRIQGTELADFLGPPPLGASKPKPPSPKKVQSRWKEKHEALRKIIRDEPTKPPDHQQCPFCERYFGPKPYDRHVEWCKDQHSKIPPSINQNGDVHKAKERLQARTKYRAPHFKSQRSVTKEKYSPGRQHTSVGMSSSATFPSPTLPRTDTLHRASISSSSTELGVSLVESSGYGKSRSSSISSTIPNLSRQNSLQKSNRNMNSHGDDKKTNTRNNKESSVISTPVLTRKQRGGSVSSQGSLEGGRSTSSSNYSANTCISDLHQVTMTHQDTPSNKPNIKTSHSNNRDLERYDPFVSAELQMMELLKSEDEDNSAPQKPTQPLPETQKPKLSESVVDLAPKKRAQSASVKSDVSASLARKDSLSRKSGSAKADKSIADSKKETIGKGVPSPLRTSPDSAFSPLPIIPNENEDFKMLSLSTLSLCSEVSLDALEPNLRTRSTSAAPRQAKQRLNMHDLLFGLDNTGNDKESNNNVVKPKRSEVERCEAQLLRSMVEFEMLLNRDNDSPPDSPPHPSNHITDSAYSSLNRRWSPVNEHISTNLDESGLSKFCHECGGRYPVPGAKFCCICGVRRLAV